MTDYPHVIYEWTFPPDRGCRIVEIRPGIVIGQERESHDAPWRDEPCPSGWKNELIALKQEVDDWQMDAVKAVQEECGNRDHCTCVGPLRHILQAERDERARDVRMAAEATRKLALCQEQRDRWYASAGQRQDELNEAHLALAWVCGSLPFESESLPAHLAPPKFVRRQVARAKAYASTCPAQRPGEQWLCPECGPGARVDEDGCCATCGEDCDLDVPLIPREEGK